MTTTYTVATLVDRTFDLLLGSERQDINQLVSSVTATATSFTVKFNPPPKVKDYITVDTEVMFVVNATLSSSQNSSVTVIRAMKGSTAASHAAAALVYVNPFFTRFLVRRTLQDEIRSWGPQVYAVKTVELTSTDYVRGYDLGSISPFYEVLSVLLAPDATTQTVSDKDWADVPFRVIQSAPTVTFPSGNGLIIESADTIFDSPRKIHVRYAAPFSVDPTFGETSTILTMGVDISEVDIAPYGAAWRLAASREMRRMLTQAMGQVADLTEYPPMYALQAAAEFKKLRDSRLADAKERLLAQYPTMRVSA